MQSGFFIHRGDIIREKGRIGTAAGTVGKDVDATHSHPATDVDRVFKLFAGLAGKAYDGPPFQDPAKMGAVLSAAAALLALGLGYLLKVKDGAGARSDSPEPDPPEPGESAQ